MRLDRGDQERLQARHAALNPDFPGPEALEPYWLDLFIDGAVVARMRVRYERTAAALPTANRAKQRDLSRPWIMLRDQEILAHDPALPALAIHWADAGAVTPGRDDL